MEARKKAFDLFEQNGKPSAENRKDEKKSKKKKSKRDGRKDKKKRNRVKKRKRNSSSSSSDSDASGSSSDSEASVKKNESDNADARNSIRIQMRNFIAKGTPTENNEKTGKWTMVPSISGKPIPPPAPAISQAPKESIQDKKKDEEIIEKWSKVEPIISQEEKRLLENLKGRLKSQQAKAAVKPVVAARISTEKERVRERSRDKSRDRSRDRSRSRGARNYRGRRSHSRGRRSRSRSRSRGRYRRYSRSRSGSRGRRRVERPIVNFPEPRLPPSREDKKLPARSYVISQKEDSSSNSKKVMPMIGKMPVYKKQLTDKKSEEMIEEEKVEEAPVEAAAEEVKKPRDDTWDDFMPDPLQYSALMGAPPPPPRMTEEPEVVPPGLDPEQDFEFIPKPISDAPIARKGPLPKDFQDTLDLLYDGDTPKPVLIEQKIIPDALPIEPPPMVPDPDGPQMIMAEDLSQHALLYGGFYGQDGAEEAEHKDEADEPQKEVETGKNGAANGNIKPDEADEESKGNQMDLDELAMLGIDPNDVGSGFW